MSNKYFEKSSMGEKNYPFYGILFFLSYLMLAKGLNPAGKFEYSHWLFNYKFEFIKRGLVGEILRQLSITPSFAVVNLIALIILVTVIAVFTGSMCVKLFKDRISTPFFLLALVIITHSAIIVHFSDDLGRFDTILIGLIILSLWIIDSANRKLTFLSLFLIDIVGILIHEIFFVAFIPLIISYWFFRDQGTFSFNLLRGALVILFIGVTYLVGTKGLMKTMDHGQYSEILQERSGKDLSLGAIVLFYDLGKNLSYTMERTFTLERLYHHIVMLIVFSPTFYFIVKFFSRIKVNDFDKWKTRSFYSLPISALAPLLLYPLGHDDFRWWSLVITNLFLLIIFLSDIDYIRRQLRDIAWKNRYILGLIILFSLIFGHLGIYTSFKMASKLFSLAKLF